MFKTVAITLKRLTFLFVFTMLIGLTSSFAGEVSPAELVATVNGSAITKKEFDLEMTLVVDAYMDMGKKVEGKIKEFIEQQILNNLINAELLYLDGLNSGISVSQQQLDDALKEFKARFPSDVEYEQMLADFSSTESEIIIQIKKEIVAQQFIKDTFVKAVNIEESDVRAYYDEHVDEMVEPEQVQAYHILISAGPDASPAQKNEARKEMERIHSRIVDGTDFDTMARTYSMCPSKEKGGDLGYVMRGQDDENFENTLFSLAAGEVSQVIETLNGYRLVKAGDKKAARVITFDESDEEIRMFLKKQKINQLLSEYIHEQKKSANIDILLGNQSA